MKLSNIVYVTVVSVMSCVGVFGELSLKDDSGDHICYVTTSLQESYEESYVYPYDQIYYTTCWNPLKFFRCTRTRRLYRTEWRTVYQTTYVRDKVCCPGYEQNGDVCIPLCNECDNRHATCVRPDVCKCDAGYHGNDCSSTCSNNMCGDNCGISCLSVCGTNADTCNPSTCECSCNPGWRGDFCDEPCPYGYYGPGCALLCQCQNGAECDYVDGSCTCTAGWQPPLCDIPCPIGMHGDNCSYICDCQHGGDCNPTNGACDCTPGWLGDVCSVPCDDGYYGQDCLEICDCRNDGICDNENGDCHCLAGYHGENCEGECDHGYYGDGCLENCLCQNGADCAIEDGFCTCTLGFQGVYCNESACEVWKFGENCTHKCPCVQSNSLSCHPGNGQCYCKPGYDGSNCEEECPHLWYGEGCMSICQCQNGAHCDHVTGVCTCPPGFNGTFCDASCPPPTFGLNCEGTCTVCENDGVCDPVSGMCICDEGWRGDCTLPCLPGTYGMFCNNTCDCENGASCDPISGHCICNDGWIGDRCADICQSWKYGFNCEKDCDCNEDNSAGCNAVDGTCVCHSGYQGVKCDSMCSSGTWGSFCKTTCDCGQGSACDPVDGTCECPPGYSGDRCENTAVSNRPKSNKTSDLSAAGIGAVVGVLVFSLLLVILLIVLWRCRRNPKPIVNGPGVLWVRNNEDNLRYVDHRYETPLDPGSSVSAPNAVEHSSQISVHDNPMYVPTTSLRVNSQNTATTGAYETIDEDVLSTFKPKVYGNDNPYLEPVPHAAGKNINLLCDSKKKVKQINTDMFPSTSADCSHYTLMKDLKPKEESTYVEATARPYTNVPSATPTDEALTHDYHNLSDPSEYDNLQRNPRLISEVSNHYCTIADAQLSVSNNQTNV